MVHCFPGKCRCRERNAVDRNVYRNAKNFYEKRCIVRQCLRMLKVSPCLFSDALRNVVMPWSHIAQTVLLCPGKTLNRDQQTHLRSKDSDLC